MSKPLFTVSRRPLLYRPPGGRLIGYTVVKRWQDEDGVWQYHLRPVTTSLADQIHLGTTMGENDCVASEPALNARNET